jgi:hypothetical protein
MNNIETPANKQCFAIKPNKSLDQHLRQAIRIVNAEYQQIDWEDQTFLTRVLTDALTFIENSEVVNASS